MDHEVPQISFQEKMQATLKETQKWFNNDEHAGATAGTILATIFLVIGLCILLIQENNQSVPTWRKLTGILLLVLGTFAMIISIAFACQ